MISETMVCTVYSIKQLTFFSFQNFLQIRSLNYQNKAIKNPSETLHYQCGRYVKIGDTG